MATEVYELRIRGTAGFQPNECVQHFVGGNLTADATRANGDFLIDAWNTNIRPLWLDLLPDTYYLLSVQARRVVPPISVVTFQQFTYGTQQGGRGAGYASDQTCPCVHFIPGMGFKSKGKTFLPCVGKTEIIDNQYDSAYATAVGAWASAMLTNFGTSGKTWQIVVYSRKLGTWSLAVGAGLSTRIGFQKRRRSPV